MVSCVRNLHQISNIQQASVKSRHNLNRMFTVYTVVLGPREHFNCHWPRPSWVVSYHPVSCPGNCAALCECVQIIKSEQVSSPCTLHHTGLCAVPVGDCADVLILQQSEVWGSAWVGHLNSATLGVMNLSAKNLHCSVSGWYYIYHFPTVLGNNVMLIVPSGGGAATESCKTRLHPLCPLTMYDDDDLSIRVPSVPQPRIYLGIAAGSLELSNCHIDIHNIWRRHFSTPKNASF